MLAITTEHRQEAARLRKLWDERTERLSQQEFGAKYQVGNQSAVSHFLQGRMPISLKAAMGFATGLRCKIEDFSPRLAGIVSPVALSPSTPIDWGSVVQRARPPSTIPHEMPAHLEFMASLQHKSALFAEFLYRPEIRQLVRLIAPADPHDVVVSLMHSAFDHGFDQGASFIAMKMPFKESSQKE
jgi:hypothetical protein